MRKENKNLAVCELRKRKMLSSLDFFLFSPTFFLNDHPCSPVSLKARFPHIHLQLKENLGLFGLLLSERVFLFSVGRSASSCCSADNLARDLD